MEEFFIKCTPDEVEEVSQLLRELGYREWSDLIAMKWIYGSNGIVACKDGVYLVYRHRNQPLKTIPELREMVAGKKSIT